MTLPNFIVIGARKSGSTSMEHYLREHPDVFMSPVEAPNYFSARDKVTTLEAYEALFDGAAGEHAIGERSPSYLRNTDAAARIHDRIPDARLIAILRNPVERAFSDYLMQYRGDSGRQERREVDEAFTLDTPYVQESLYREQLERYYDRFPRAQIRVYRLDDLAARPARLLSDAFAFLGVDDGFLPNVDVQHNVGWVPRSAALHAAYRSGVARAVRPLLPRRARSALSVMVRRINGSAPPGVPPAIRERLFELYREDMDRLEQLTGLDLDAWRAA